MLKMLMNRAQEIMRYQENTQKGEEVTWEGKLSKKERKISQWTTSIDTIQISIQ